MSSERCRPRADRDAERCWSRSARCDEGDYHYRHGTWRSLVSVPVWGTGGRGFKSRRPDHLACRSAALQSSAMPCPLSPPDDERLSHVVATQRSWRGVARALGLNATSAGTIRALKRRAGLLGLDVSHFTHQRTWTDRALRDAVRHATTWSELLRDLGLSGGDARLRLKGHAVRLGLDITHLEQAVQPPTAEFASARPDPALLRNAAESFAAAWFVIRGFQVAVPVQPASYDLLVTFTDGTQRI